MPNLFEKEYASSFDTGAQETAEADAAASRLVEALNDDNIDEELSEAEKRIAKAMYYKAIVRGGVVEDDGTAQAAEVNDEAKVWARQQMAVLLGLVTAVAPAPKADATFDEREVKALKLLASKLVAMGEEEAKPEPVVKKVSAPTTPVVKKVGAPPAPPQPKPTPKSPQKTNAKPAPVSAKKSGQASKGVDEDRVADGEEFVDASGRTCRMVPNPILNPDHPSYDPDVFNPESPAYNPKAKRRVKIVVARQVKNNQARPMPSPQEMAGISMAQSVNAVNQGVSASASSPFGADDASPNLFVAAAAKSMVG
jgi:hypothetical protein